MDAATKKLTLAGLAAAVVAALSDSNAAVSFVEKYLGTSPYLFLLASYRNELISIIFVAIATYYIVSGGYPARYSRWRLNWATRPTQVWGLHPEECLLLTVICVLTVSLAVHSFFKVTRIYNVYGLHYVADKLCKGEFDDALMRMKTLKANPLWEKYRSQLQFAIERNTYVNELVDRRLANFQTDRERGSPEELLAQAMELKVIFGSNAWRAIDARRDLPETVRWRRFLSELRC